MRATAGSPRPSTSHRNPPAAGPGTDSNRWPRSSACSGAGARRRGDREHGGHQRRGIVKHHGVFPSGTRGFALSLLLPSPYRPAPNVDGRVALPEVAAFVERLRHESILPVVGPSGAGKSSFVSAGVIPRLREQGRWVVVRNSQATQCLGLGSASGAEGGRKVLHSWGWGAYTGGRNRITNALKCRERDHETNAAVWDAGRVLRVGRRV